LTSSFTQTFEKYISSVKDDIAHDAIELDGPQYIILSQKNASEYGPQDYEIKVYKIDNTGDFIDSLEIAIDDDYMLSNTRYIFELIGNDLVIVGTCRNRITSDLQLYLAFLNTDLKFLKDTILGDSKLSDHNIDFLINEFGNIIIGGFCENPTDDNNIIICEYNPNTEVFRRKAHSIQHVSINTIVELPEINAYQAQFVFNGDDILQINRDSLSIDTLLQVSPNFDPGLALNIPGKNNYVVFGKKGNYSSGVAELAFRVMSISGEILEEHTYGVQDTNCFFMYNEADCKDSSYLYLGGTHNFTWYPPFLTPERRWIYINKLRLDGSIIWQHFYKGELNYMPYKVLATSDGGALILSHKYDWNSPYPDQRDIHILKVDSNGYYSGMVNLDEVSQKPLQILVYPNPASTTLNIATGHYSWLDFILFNLQGKEVLRQKLHGSMHTISVDHLPPAIYIYRFYHDRQLLETSKIVIQ
jgi:hypothetical protein